MLVIRRSRVHPSRCRVSIELLKYRSPSALQPIDAISRGSQLVKAGT